MWLPISIARLLTPIRAINDSAIKEYDEAIRLRPNDAAAYANRGSVYASKSDNDRAIKDYSEAIRLDPKNMRAYGVRGDAYRGKSDFDRAAKDYGKVIELAGKPEKAHWTYWHLSRRELRAARQMASGRGGFSQGDGARSRSAHGSQSTRL